MSSSTTSIILHFALYILIFLYGPDSYRLMQAKGALAARYKAKYPSNINLIRLDLAEANGQNDLENALKSSSFFNEHRLIICKNIFAKKATSEPIAKYIEQSQLADLPDITLMAVEDLSDKDLLSKNRPLFKLLSEKSRTVKTFEFLGKPGLSGWAKDEFRSRDCSIQNDALEVLIDLVGNNSWALINEIDKLSAYKKAGEITTQDIGLLVSPEIDLNIFDLMDALGSRNYPRTLELLHYELRTGRDPYYILTMIASQLRNLLMLKGLLEKGCSQAEVAKKSGLHPFVVKKAMAQAKNFSTTDLKTKYKNLLDIDIAAKKGIVRLEDLLYNLALN